MPLGTAASGALERLTELYNTIGHTNDENEQPVKNPTDDERRQLRELVAEAAKELGEPATPKESTTPAPPAPAATEPGK